MDWRMPSHLTEKIDKSIFHNAAPNAMSLDCLGDFEHQEDPSCLPFLETITSRQFCILSSKYKNIIAMVQGRKAMITRLAGELPADALQNYRPIEWHTDIHSGYRWDPNLFYLDVRIAPVAGTEIKVPRELSRFQHIAQLAQGSLTQGSNEFLLQVLDWIVANPVRRGVNWACAMDVALRAINWIWGLKFFAEKVTDYPNLLGVITHSLYQHGKHIENNLDYYEECTGNHYLSDIAGLLYISAVFPQFAESDRWLLFALQQLVSEMERTVYQDGSSHEGSTYYHRLVAELFVSCAALAERIPHHRRKQLLTVDLKQHKVRPALTSPNHSSLNLESAGQLLPCSFYKKLARMAEFTLALTKPNGWVPQFGDNDSGRAHKLLFNPATDIRDHAHIPATIGELLGRTDLQAASQRAEKEAKLIAGGLDGIIQTPLSDARLKKSDILFPDAGIAISRRDTAWLAVTCGQNGQGGRGGHNHNDKLSFELNVCGHDFIVDGGCPAYTSAPEIRNRYRATSAHSTVVVMGNEQDPLPSGMKGLFRLPETCNPTLKIEKNGTITGSHRGYSALHQRQFFLTENTLLINDSLPLEKERWVVFNLDPDVKIADLVSENQTIRWQWIHASGLLIRVEVMGADLAIVGEGCFGLGYGVPVPTLNIKVRMVGAETTTRMAWTPA